MSSDDGKENKPIHGGRNLILLGLGAIAIALFTTSISIYFYSKGDIYIDRSRPGYMTSISIYFYSKGDIYIDRSRPGYISENEKHDDSDDRQEKYSNEGAITEKSLNEYLEELDRVTERIEASHHDFGPDPLSDEDLMITSNDDKED